MSEKDESREINEKRHYKGKKKSDIVNYPVLFRRNYLSPKNNKEVVNAPISSHRIIFKILNDISHDQFRPGNEKQLVQLSLFEDDFLTENNTFARFTFRVTDIDKNNDYKSVKKGLEFLENYKKDWYKSKNANGKIIKSYGGLISQANITEGKISFLVSSYWIGQLLAIPKYNVAYLETAWALTKTKQLLFYLWLIEVPDQGTKLNFYNFQDAYQYDYKTPRTFAKNVLKSIKNKLDEISNKSFNYSVKGDLISIVPYYTKDVDLKFNKKTIDRQQITQKLHYWKTRHTLNKSEIDILKSLINIDNSTYKIFLKSYDSFVKKCKENKEKVTQYTGEAFIKLFQEEIIKVYNDSVWKDISPNGYPVIN